MCENAHTVYTESYIGLCHGTTSEAAEKIITTQHFMPSSSGWCGKGVYFYDIKAKARWWADRTSNDLGKKLKRKFKPQVVYADIIDIPLHDVLDLRSFKALKEFAAYVDEFLEEFSFEIDEDLTEEEKKECTRQLLLTAFAEENNKKLIVGLFSQRMRDEYKPYIEFSKEWNILFGVETIYCVRDPLIICNIRNKKL